MFLSKESFDLTCIFRTKHLLESWRVEAHKPSLFYKLPLEKNNLQLLGLQSGGGINCLVCDIYGRSSILELWNPAIKILSHKGSGSSTRDALSLCSDDT